MPWACDGWRSSTSLAPSKKHWLDARTGVNGCYVRLIFAQDEVRVQFEIGRNDPNENKWIFDRLLEDRNKYEQIAGEELEWRRLDNKKVSMVVCKTATQGHSKENWPDLIAWLVDHYRKMDEAFSEPVRALVANMKPGGGV